MSNGLSDDKEFETNAISDVLKSGDKDKSKDSEEPKELKEPEKKLPEVKWSKESEKIPSEWCDIAKCYKWLHNRAHQKYSVLHAWFTIPAIIFSTISGTASFAQASLPLSFQAYAPMVIGSVNIIIGIFTTIQQYMKISELNESYRVSSIAWDKFARNISIELAKAPEERSMDAGHFLKVYREEFDRLMETSPSIPKGVTKEFVATFSGKKPYCCWPEKDDAADEEEDEEVRKTQFKSLKKPDECDTIIVSELGKHDWYNPARIPVIVVPPPPPTSPVIDEKSIENMLSQKIRVIQDNVKKEEQDKRKSLDEIRWIEEEKLRLDEEEKERKEKVQNQFRQAALEVANKLKIQNKKIEENVKLFRENYSRDPLKEELQESLEGQVDDEIMSKFLDRYEPNLGDDNV
jgi:hypothetical protein